MQTYVVLFTLLTFCGVAVSAGLQQALNVAQYLADIHQALPSSCVFIINWEGDVRGEKRFIFSLEQTLCLCQKCARFLCHQFTLENIFEKNRIWLNHGTINAFGFDDMLQLG
jgi:hypothetical protein